MIYTLSEDGKYRASVRVILRIDRSQIKLIKAYLKEKNQPHSDKDIREFINSCVDVHYPSCFSETDEDREPHGEPIG